MPAVEAWRLPAAVAKAAARPEPAAVALLQVAVPRATATTAAQQSGAPPRARPPRAVAVLAGAAARRPAVPVQAARPLERPRRERRAALPRAVVPESVPRPSWRRQGSAT
ncbi:MAG TPA: hypothetical protein VF113_17395 [Stellaceae bacterium]